LGLTYVLPMKRYANLDGQSGVLAYDLRPDAIVLRLLTGGDYEYTYASAGRDNVEAMKRLAIAGRGLATYVNQHKPPYARKTTAKSAAL
jgi:hypothetical protein